MAFFVISGFVLRVALDYGPQQAWRGCTKFIASRVFRVYPIIFLSVVLAMAFPVCRVGVSGSMSPMLWMKNLLLLDVSVNGTLWALQVEMLMVPVILGLFFLERSFGPKPLCAIVLVATGLAFVPGWALWPPLSANLFSFVLGMMIPTFGCRMANRFSCRTSNAITLSALTMFLLPGPLLGTFSIFSAILEAYSAYVIISFVSYRSDLALSRLLNLRVLQWLGLSTGSYYVLHMATIVPMMLFANAIIPEAWVASMPRMSGVAVLISWLLLLIPLCRVSYHLVEAQGIAAGKWVIRRSNLDGKKSTKTEPIAAQRKVA